MTESGKLRILYLVHDLSDPAVLKRTVLLRDGGATVTLAGFRRDVAPVESVAGCPAINLGQTHNGRFLQRIASVLREVFLLRRHQSLFAEADVIIARNLEMLAIAVRGKSLCASSRPVIVYECLDIHRLLLSQGPVGTMLRRLEGWLSRRASALIVSSPAFIRHYFDRLSNVHLPVKLLENKIYDPALHVANHPPRPAGPQWKIGWFGAIRCRKSLGILAQLVRSSNGAVEVVIRGRPAYDQLPGFHSIIQNTPGLTFLGPYKNPEDLESIYRDVHFTWAIDMFEEGLNSSWLLPNRLYEGGAMGSVPIAVASVETGRFLASHHIGVILDEPLDDALTAFFNPLTADQYRALELAANNVPQTTWIINTEEVRALVLYLHSLRAPT